jgi:hypothetical protein
MTGASKILTVSYGTFSCTLEGFDEPFNTMKAIAEYFRDLAAEDRYFGAEPPTPDTAMLHQIAEREMKRRVEAKVSANGVILRATDSERVDAPAPRILTAPNVTVNSPVARPKGEAAPKPEQMFEDQHAAGQNAGQSAPQSLIGTPPVQGVSDSVAEKLARIRNAMVDSRAAGDTTRAPATITTSSAAAAAAAKAEAEAHAARAKVAAEQAAEQTRAKEAAEAAEKAAAQARAKEAEQAAEQAAAQARAKEAAEAAEKVAAQAAEKSAQDDAMIAALAGSFDDETVAVDGRFDDETDDTVTPLDSMTDGDDSLMASLANAMAASTAPEATVALVTKPENDVADDLANGLADDLADEFDGDDMSPLPPKAETGLGVITPDADSYSAPNAVTEPLPAAAADVPQTADLQTADLQTPDTQAPTENPTLQRARARVIKIRRAPVDAVTAPAASGLSAEAEADLMRELEALQGDATIDAPTPQTPTPETPDDANDSAGQVRPQRPVSPRRRASDMAGAEDDASVKRLLDQTNTELQGTENRRRLSAISHLKAAVAATVADREAGGDNGPTEEMRMNPYRNDLERVVRPRPAAELVAPMAAAPERTSPLMLVSEQRIDTPRVKPTEAPNHITPVRPRRVVAGSLAADLAVPQNTDAEVDLDAALDGSDQRNIFGASTSFADYAERLGAESLADLLEAAAAYSANVEGHADVSRPQMVSHVLTVQPELENDREQMLASFGTLLRDGRIEKVRRGYFVLSESSPIMGEVRKAAKG